MRHTPGPHIVDDGDTDLIGIFADDGDPICYFAEPSQPPGYYRVLRPAEARATAQLYAAAPEMYAALKAYEKLDNKVANCEEHDPEDVPEKCEFCFPYADDARCKMRAAIAKARGEPAGGETEGR
ncbi:MAG: hypothetical protein GY906_22350 [bacterium]|nr:hypothetical protein [bacterium]